MAATLTTASIDSINKLNADSHIKDAIISVISRHVTKGPDGKWIPDERIVPGITFNEHWTVLAPPARLVGWVYKRRAMPSSYSREVFEIFRCAYDMHLRKPLQSAAIDEIVRDLESGQDKIIVCVEPYIGEQTECHRLDLANAILRRAKAGSVELRHI